jgi:hypothetical protein
MRPVTPVPEAGRSGVRTSALCAAWEQPDVIEDLFSCGCQSPEGESAPTYDIVARPDPEAGIQ